MTTKTRREGGRKERKEKFLKIRKGKRRRTKSEDSATCWFEARAESTNASTWAIHEFGFSIKIGSRGEEDEGGKEFREGSGAASERATILEASKEEPRHKGF